LPGRNKKKGNVREEVDSFRARGEANPAVMVGVLVHGARLSVVLGMNR
jgi:hypothetical protein